MIGNILGGAMGKPIVNDFESISTTVVGAGGTATITFSNIPQTFQHLQIRAFVNVSTGNNPAMRFNSDTGNNYSRHGLTGNGTTAGAFAAASTSFIGIAQAFGLGTNSFGVAIVDILDYTSTNKNKTVRILAGHDTNGGGGIELDSGAWYNSSTAVSTITIIPQTGSFNQYTSFALYGIKG